MQLTGFSPHTQVFGLQPLSQTPPMTAFGLPPSGDSVVFGMIKRRKFLQVLPTLPLAAQAALGVTTGLVVTGISACGNQKLEAHIPSRRYSEKMWGFVNTTPYIQKPDLKAFLSTTNNAFQGTAFDIPSRTMDSITSELKSWFKDPAITDALDQLQQQHHDNPQQFIHDLILWETWQIRGNKMENGYSNADSTQYLGIPFDTPTGKRFAELLEHEDLVTGFNLKKQKIERIDWSQAQKPYIRKLSEEIPFDTQTKIRLAAAAIHLANAPEYPDEMIKDPIEKSFFTWHLPAFLSPGFVQHGYNEAKDPTLSSILNHTTYHSDPVAKTTLGLIARQYFKIFSEIPSDTPREIIDSEQQKTQTDLSRLCDTAKAVANVRMAIVPSQSKLSQQVTVEITDTRTNPQTRERYPQTLTVTIYKKNGQYQSTLTHPNEPTPMDEADLKNFMIPSETITSFKEIVDVITQTFPNQTIIQEAVIAQAIHESGILTKNKWSDLAKTHNNCLGIKFNEKLESSSNDRPYSITGQITKTTPEWGKDTQQFKDVSEVFCTYKNYYNCLQHYKYKLENQSNYRDEAVFQVTTPREFWSRLQEAKYASDPDYAVKCEKAHQKVRYLKALGEILQPPPPPKKWDPFGWRNRGGRG